MLIFGLYLTHVACKPLANFSHLSHLNPSIGIRIGLFAPSPPNIKPQERVWAG